MAKDGTDWSGAFGKDPAQDTDRRGARNTKAAESPGVIGKNREGNRSEDQDNTPDENEDSSDSDESDLGLHDATNHEEFTDDDEHTDKQNVDDGSAPNESSNSKNPINQVKDYNENKKGLHRKQRGLMQWKPMRNLAFAKDEAKFAVRRTLNKASLSGRQPDVETET